MKQISFEDLQNIIKLLDDPDKKVFELLKPEILSVANQYYDYLKKEYSNSNKFLVKERLSEILSNFSFRESSDEFRNIPLLDNGDIDLETAVFKLAKFNYPGLNSDSYKSQLDMMSDVIKDRLRYSLDPLFMIEIINEYIFSEQGFHGNHNEYMEAENSYINMVIERKTGIPISLSAVYLFLTSRLGLPFYGVGMPGHFIIKYQEGNLEYFIDPFYEGQILSRQDCINFLLFSGFGYNEKFLESSSNKDIFLRFMRNLIRVYKDQNDNEKVQNLLDLTSIISINY